MRIIKKVKSEISIDIEPDKSLVFSKINLHDSIKFFIVIAQFFGVMPLYNIGNDYFKIQFKWKSLRVTYAVLNALGALISGLFWIVKFCRDGLYVDQTGEYTN